MLAEHLQVKTPDIANTFTEDKTKLDAINFLCYKQQSTGDLTMDLLTLCDRYDTFPGLYDARKVLAASKVKNVIGEDLKHFLDDLKRDGASIEYIIKEQEHIYSARKAIKYMARIMHERAEFLMMREDHRDHIDWDAAAGSLLQSYESPFARANFSNRTFYAWRGEKEEKENLTPL